MMTTLKYVTCYTLVLTFLSLKSTDILLLILMAVGPLFHCHLSHTLRRTLQQQCQLREATASSKYFLMPKANQEMTFSTIRELLLNIPPTVMLCSWSWPGCTTYEMGFTFVAPLLLLIQWIRVAFWFFSAPHICLYFHLWQGMCLRVT